MTELDKEAERRTKLNKYFQEKLMITSAFSTKQNRIHSKSNAVKWLTTLLITCFVRFNAINAGSQMVYFETSFFTTIKK